MTSMRGICFLLLFLSFWVFQACGGEEDTESSKCPNGEEVDYEGDSYCILIEEGFLTADCPSAFPNGQNVETVIVCSTMTELPDGLQAELERQGILTPENKTNAYNNTQRCLDGQSCLQPCELGNCVGVCATGSRCTASCEGGGCSRFCESDADCVFTCLGGNCDFNCADGSDCIRDCDGGGCNAPFWDGSKDSIPTVNASPDLVVGTGDSFECGGSSTCIDTCELGQCSFDCFNTSDCTNTCLGGDCLFTCRDDASCLFSCAGGGCVFQSFSSKPFTEVCSTSPCFYEYMVE